MPIRSLTVCIPTVLNCTYSRSFRTQMCMSCNGLVHSQKRSLCFHTNHCVMLWFDAAGLSLHAVGVDV